jgi:hypothetical protein
MCEEVAKANKNMVTGIDFGQRGHGRQQQYDRHNMMNTEDAIIDLIRHYRLIRSLLFDIGICWHWHLLTLKSNVVALESKVVALASL